MSMIPPPGPPPQPGETLDRLVGDWWIYQLRGGHRFSTDDVACAWRARLAVPDAQRCLDIGSGIGSVGLCLLGLFERVGHTTPTLVGVEAQEVSHHLAARSTERNGLTGRVRWVRGDLRDPDVLPAEARFDLITGSPPYFPLGTGAVSPHPQRAACRMELRGSVVDYCEAARRWLAPGGRFVYVMAARDTRNEAAPLAHGFDVLERFDVVFREGEAPMIAVMTCARSEDGPHPPRRTVTLTIRDSTGEMTDDYLAFRAVMGFGPPAHTGS